MPEAPFISQLFSGALIETIIISAPVLVTSVVVGLIISIIQAATSIQEQTLTFVPKLFAVFLILIVTADFLIEHFTEYTFELFNSLASVGRGEQ